MPIITAVAAIAISVLMSSIYKPFDAGLTGLGDRFTDNKVLGGFVIRKGNLRTPGREEEGEESLVLTDDSA